MFAPRLPALVLAPLLAVGLATAEAIPVPADRPEAPPVDFLREVRPILAERCLLCHGNDADEGGLRLNSLEAAMVDLGGYAALVPGDVEASELLWRVRAEDESERMPPADHDQALTAAEVSVLERWVAEGAPWVEHWAFAPLDPPAPPEVTADEPAWAQAWASYAEGRAAADPGPSSTADSDVEPSAGARSINPVDAWIRAGLVDAELTPAPDASDLTWLRRASFDLVGLPPTPAEQRAFLADPPAERRALAADRLLASPHFGERWARHLMDLVRYAETRGHEFDFAIPNAWEYRDYLVRALNADVGWDVLLTEHVAGDLVEPARRSPEGWNESVLGTGFWHLGEGAHSPVDLLVDRADRTANQLDVFGKTFLGLTLACARCHDHKFDPIPTKDYYALSGYVQSASYRQVRFETLETERELRAESDRLWREKERYSRRDGQRGTAEKALERLEHAVDSAEVARDLVPEYKRALRRWAAPRTLFDFEPLDEDASANEDEDAAVRVPTWDELGWTVEGAAFGAGPMARDSVPAWYEQTEPDGLGFINSHDGRQAPDSPAADDLTGRLLSPPFDLDRDRMLLRVAGGNHPGETEVRLLVDGEVMRTATGHDGGELRDVIWDLSDLVSTTGAPAREARLEVVDSHTGGWGHITLDSVRLEREVDEEDVAQRVVYDDETEASVLIAWHAWLAEHPEEEGPRGRASATTLWRAGVDPWWQDGAAFSERGREEPWLTGDPDAPIAAFAPDGTGGFDPWPPPTFAGGGVGLDPAWLGLERDAVSGAEETDVDWDGAGRTLRLPAWTLGEGSLWYLVRGRGVVLAPVEGHRLLRGPLHGGTRLAFDTGHEWRWVEHATMAEYAGLRAHIELSPADGQAWVGIAAVAQGAGPPFYPHNFPQRDRTRRLVAAYPELGGPLPPAGIVEREVAELRADLAARVPKSSRTAPALLDGNPVDQPVLVRGGASSPGEIAPRAFLVRFRDEGDLAPTTTAAGQPTSGRLQLAESMLERTGPLVARTFANRVWMHLMGRGLVPTPDNLGTLAAYPSHPELLDTLSAELVADDWSLKSLARTIVLSRVYGLSGGAPDPQDPRRSPGAAGSPDAPAATTRALTPRLDALYGRRAPKRLDAEAVRDAVLATSGSLNTTLGGPSVPVFLTEAMTGRGRPAESGPVDGAGRRSLYLAVRRNFLPPFQLVWDYPQPSTTMGRRSSSNVPAQSLALMNDAFVVQEAERWAARLLQDGSLIGPLDTDRDRIELAWQTALGRPPLEDELARAEAYLKASHAVSPRGDVDAARTHRLATWTDLCHAIFQIKEFVHVP